MKTNVLDTSCCCPLARLTAGSQPAFKGVPKTLSEVAEFWLANNVSVVGFMSLVSCHFVLLSLVPFISKDLKLLLKYS